MQSLSQIGCYNNCVFIYFYVSKKLNLDVILFQPKYTLHNFMLSFNLLLLLLPLICVPQKCCRIFTCGIRLCRVSLPVLRFSMFRTSFNLTTGPTHEDLVEKASQAVLDGTSKWSCKIACSGIVTGFAPSNCSVNMLLKKSKICVFVST